MFFVLWDWVNEKVECIGVWIVFLFFYNKCVVISVIIEIEKFYGGSWSWKGYDVNWGVYDSFI